MDKDDQEVISNAENLYKALCSIGSVHPYFKNDATNMIHKTGKITYKGNDILKLFSQNV